MSTEKFDFSGWATKNDLLCSDGRTIRKDAFKHCDGMTVPLVWNHNHKGADNVLGHALLENREEGVYCYGSFNDTEWGKHAKMLVQHGDITNLSIYANQLQQRGGDVIHGAIREVSLVLAGANPGASILSVNLAHGDDCETAGEIYTDEEIIAEEIEHTAIFGADKKAKAQKEETKEKLKDEPKDDSSEEEPKKEQAKKPAPKKQAVKHSDEEDSDEETVQDVIDSMNDEQKDAMYALIGMALNGEEAAPVEHADAGDGDGKTLKEIIDTMTEKQKKAMYALIGMALEQNAAKHSDLEEDENSEGGNDNMATMTHNVFDAEGVEETNELSHAEMMDIISDSQRYGSMKESALQHGITDIQELFPDAKNVRNTPDWVKRDDSWVSIVINGVHHSPFSRIKSMYADITEADARAKGYIKGNEKFDEVFPLFKRVTTPQTIYKKQSLDRDDIIDITGFDVVSWLKGEMRGMLEEELARALLVGDGRSAASPDKINPLNIRPVWTDDDVYTIKVNNALAANATADQKAKAFIRAAIKSRKDYKGSGNPTMLMTEDMLTDCLLMEDQIGHVIYDTEEKLRTALRVSRIITVPVFENQTRIVDGATHYLDGMYLNLADYTLGADKGGSVSMFEDFDIDFNKEKYLMETRCSGALTKPYSACVIEHSFTISLTVEPEDDETEILGKLAGDLQSGVYVHDDYISGTLKYVTGYTGFSGNPEEQEGNYLALKFEATEGATTTIFLTNGTGTTPVELDSDMNCVVRVSDKDAQKFIVKTTKNDFVVEKTYSLSSLKCEEA